MTIEIALNRGMAALVDEADLELVSRYRWCALSRKRTTYATATVRSNTTNSGYTSISMHRLLMEAPSNLQVDHINHDGLDNRRANLRLATISQNGGNRRPKTGAGFKGVSFIPRISKWEAKIEVDGRSRYLGHFVDAQAAAMAYDTAAQLMWGEFANLNFPERKAA